MKKLFFVIFSFCIASTFAISAGMHDDHFKKDRQKNTYPYKKNDEQEPKLDPGHPVKKHQMKDAYSAPGRINTTNPWNFFLWGEFLYWQALQEEMSLAKHFEMVNGAEQGHVVTMDFDFKPAFKVGLGFHFKRDDWSLLAEYTRYYSTNSQRETRSATSTINMDRSWWPTITPDAESLYGRWKLEMDLIDLNLLRAYYLGTRLLLQPFFGMRGAFIDQKLDAYYVPLSSTDEVYANAKSDSWAIGPRAGIDFRWYFSSKFFFYSTVAASLLYTEYKVYHKAYDYILPTELDWNYRDKYHFLRPNLEFALGLAWGSYFSDNKVHIDFFAGYEFHTFWGQNMMKFYADKTQCDVLGTAYPGNLYLHGLSTGILFNW